MIGHALGRALGDGRGEQPAHARAAIWTSVLASNAPDLDFIAPRFAHDRKLAYLIEHRGYTHTLPAAIAIGLVLGVLCIALAGVRERGARLRVMAIGVLAALLHIAFDGLNNYGVHPFSPLDDHWLYGDALFIVEPWLLAALIPQLALAGKSRLGRALGYALAAGLLAALWIPALVPASTALAASVALLASFALQRTVRPRAAPSLYAAAAVVLMFGAGSALARWQLRAELARAAPRERVADLVLTPLPGNPLCWSGLALTRDDGDLYRARFAGISLAPALLPSARCAFMPRGTTTAPLQPAQLRSRSPALSFTRELSAPLSELRGLRERACEVEVALRFMRAPFWLPADREHAAVVGDLRYDNEVGLGFAELGAGNRCRDTLPRWVPPRADLLAAP